MFIATIGIWAVKNHLNRVIDYITDNNKTTGEFYDELHNVIDYVGSDYKTEQKLYVTGINCSSETAYQEMINMKKFYHKEDGILAFHSYKKGEVTPELAHEVGLQVAKEMWGDRFQVIISTHLNTDHIHNHFVINSISYVDGNYKKYSGYLKCADCGNNLYRKTRPNTKTACYYCGKYINDKSCTKHYITEIELDNLVVSAINLQINLLCELKDIINDNFSTAQANYEIEIKKLKR